MFNPNECESGNRNRLSFWQDKVVGPFNLVFALLMATTSEPVVLVAHVAWIVYLCISIKLTKSKVIRVVYGILAFAVVCYLIYRLYCWAAR